MKHILIYRIIINIREIVDINIIIISQLLPLSQKNVTLRFSLELVQIEGKNSAESYLPE